MIKQPKLTKTTKQKLKTILTKKKDQNCITEDVKFAIEINGEITGKEAIKKYNQWKRS